MYSYDKTLFNEVSELKKKLCTEEITCVDESFSKFESNLTIELLGQILDDVRHIF
jgi:hypothetical protein